MSIYLQPSDFVNFGLPSTTSINQITQASAIIDGYTKRQPWGMVYNVDYLGNPCFMSSGNSLATLIAPSGILLGQNVVVTVTGNLNIIQVGDVLILDRANSQLIESCVVVSTNIYTRTLVLSSVANNHATNATLDAGLTIFEEKTLVSQRPLTQLSYWPIANLISGVGQYGYQRRSSIYNDDVNLLANLNDFGGGNGWTFFSVNDTQINYLTGDIWIPSGIYMSYFTAVRIWYVAGWTYANLPYEIKQACANIVTAIAGTPNISGNIKLLRAGDTEIQRFSASYLDSNTQNLLDTYCVRVIG